MMNPKCLHIAVDQVKRDPALLPGGRGARKLIVTSIYADKEQPVAGEEWRAPAVGQPCPVHLMPHSEMAMFNQDAEQDRHYHKNGTEIYEVLEGEVAIQVEDKLYHLHPHDALVVFPGTIHEVKKGSSPLLCRVVTFNCGGGPDKFCV